MSGKTFTFELTTTVDLSIPQIWPDGDGPDDPTDVDVVELIQSIYGGPANGRTDVERMARQWNLLDDLTLYVDGRRVQ